VNAERQSLAPGRRFDGSSCDDTELKSSPSKALDYIIAPPRMAHYIDYSTKIYQIYLKYVAPEDCHVYSIDEIMMDVTHYLDSYQMTPRALAGRIIQDIHTATGITATAGIGTNLYLCKVAMDIVAKHVQPDKDGVCIAQLDEMSYRKLLWGHRPLTDFWRVGPGYQKKLEAAGLFTMGDIARCSLGGSQDYYNEDLLYGMFGVNAELLIDHAWGWEPTTIAQVKAYQTEVKSVSSGQVLQCPYDAEKGRLIVREMTEQLVLDLVGKRLVTDQVVLTVGYDANNLADGKIKDGYKGEVATDRYGRKVPKHAHGTANLGCPTSSAQTIMAAVMELYGRIINPALLIRRVYVAANHVADENQAVGKGSYEQLDLFTDYEALEREREKEARRLDKERRLQEAMLSVKKKYGKSAVLKGMDLQEGATAMERNRQIGGHKA